MKYTRAFTRCASKRESQRFDGAREVRGVSSMARETYSPFLKNLINSAQDSWSGDAL